MPGYKAKCVFHAHQATEIESVLNDTINPDYMIYTQPAFIASVSLAVSDLYQ